MNRPNLIDLGTAACGTTFSGGSLRIRKKMPDGTSIVEPLEELVFESVWRRSSDSWEVVRRETLTVLGPDLVILPPFTLFSMPENYFLNIYATSAAGDKFEIYRAKIQLATNGQ